ncbi:MAG: YobA family protein [Lachnospiraceae bacterium]|nr:YobA family protein [Lachnospiraceae bacterium]
MKRIVVIILSVFYTLTALPVCAEEETEAKTFCAAVLEIQASSILVQPNSDTDEYDSSAQMYVGLDEVDHAQLEEFLGTVKVDDTVQITYNGIIMETYPAQIIASDIECLEISEIAASVAELIESEGFQTEFSKGGSEYCSEYAESLTIWPSAEEDDPEGAPDEEVDYMVTLGWITVFHYIDSEMAKTVSEAFAPDDPSMFAMDGESVVIDYVAPIRLYLQEECIVLYGGTNETAISLLDEELGEPFAHNVF